MTDTPTPTRVIFLSAVSNEFHNVPAEQRHVFHSYRSVLKQAFDTLARGQYEVIVQEDLVQGFGDLLETLENEVARSLFVVHLVGDLAGFQPESATLRKLYERRPDLLETNPEVRAAIGDGAGITYTQWEFYLAVHHGKDQLVFEAQPDAPRSPLYAPIPSDAASQDAHRRRIEITGHHRGSFHDQGDVARRAMRSFLHFHVDPLVDPVEPSAEDLAEAWAHQVEIVGQLAAAIKKPNTRDVPVIDPANVAAFVAAVRAAAERWCVNLATIVDIAARYEEEVRAAAGGEPTFKSLYDEAFAQLALGDYTASAFNARRAADLALKHLQQQPEFDHIYREDAGNALLLLYEAAEAAHEIPAAIAALEEAGSLIDKENYPLTWADVHEPLAKFLLEQAKWDRADELISEIIDIREDHQGENHPALAPTLLLWAHLLGAQANYTAMESVAARAERIFNGDIPLDLAGIAIAMRLQGSAMQSQGRMEEAEPLKRGALHLGEQICGRDHPSVGIDMSNLALLLMRTHRQEEAESLLRQALMIHEQSFGPSHLDVSIDLSNLALLLGEENRLEEAEPLMRRAFSITEQIYGPDHPNVGVALSNLAQVLRASGRHEDAESLMRRALMIHEESFGTEHPSVAVDLRNLALLLKETGRLEEAKAKMLRALQILLRLSAVKGYEHPDLHRGAVSYAGLLKQMGQSDEEILRQMDSLCSAFGLSALRLLWPPTPSKNSPHAPSSIIS